MISSGLRDKRVTLLRKVETDGGRFGRGASAPAWEEHRTVWANVTFARGTKALRHGALDAYDVIMVRTLYVAGASRSMRLRYDGRVYEIESFNSDRTTNDLQITAHEVIQ